jgi:hypothetical protein
MSRFAFTLVDAEAEQFCEEIVQDMTAYGISESEALRRLNAIWKGLTIGGEDDITYHLGAGEWAARLFDETEAKGNSGSR